MTRPEARVDAIAASAYRIPTTSPESDGTFEWTSTTLVLVEATGAGKTGLGYTYASDALVRFVAGELAGVAVGSDAMDVPGTWERLRRAIRNNGRSGLVSMALSAVDTALWDLKARILDLPLTTLLGAVRDAVPAYGSGGFTSMSDVELAAQLGGWAAEGLGRVKIKVGRSPGDPARAQVARQAIGPEVLLYVDANGAYTRPEAIGMAARFADAGVCWFEEPVSSDDIEGLRFVREHAPDGMAIAAGEYGYDLFTLERLIEGGAVDVLQVDATRCGGVTEFMRADALVASHNIQLSTHTAPALHAHLACAASTARDVEYFYDHMRIEQWLFDGTVAPVAGLLRPDKTRSGLGLRFRRPDAESYRVA